MRATAFWAAIDAGQHELRLETVSKQDIQPLWADPVELQWRGCGDVDMVPREANIPELSGAFYQIHHREHAEWLLRGIAHQWKREDVAVAVLLPEDYIPNRESWFSQAIAPEPNIILCGEHYKHAFSKYEVEVSTKQDASKLKKWCLCIWNNGRGPARVMEDFELYLEALSCAAGYEKNGRARFSWDIRRPLPTSSLLGGSFGTPAEKDTGFEWLPGCVETRGILRPALACSIPPTAELILHGDGGVLAPEAKDSTDDAFADLPHSTAAVVSDGPRRLYGQQKPLERGETLLQAPTHCTHTATIRGTTQEAECIQFLMQLQIAKTSRKKECWLGVDSDVVTALYIAACTGNDRQLEHRQMAHYARRARELLRDWPCKVIVVKQNGHSLSFANTAADAATHDQGRIVTWQRGGTRYQLWARQQPLDYIWSRMLRRRIDHIHQLKLQSHSNSGWRAKETLSDLYTIWGNTGLTARERQFAERLGVGRLWDICPWWGLVWDLG